MTQDDTTTESKELQILIEKELKEGKIDAALDLLLEHDKIGSRRNKILVLKTKLKVIRQKKIDGVISISDEFLELSKITQSLQYILDGLDDNGKKRRKKVVFWLLPILLATALFLFFYFREPKLPFRGKIFKGGKPIEKVYNYRLNVIPEEEFQTDENGEFKIESIPAKEDDMIRLSIFDRDSLVWDRMVSALGYVNVDLNL